METYRIVWGDLESVEYDQDPLDGSYEHGTKCMAVLVDADGEEIDAECFLVDDGDPDAREKLTSEGIYRATEDRLLARNGVDRSWVVEIESAQ